MDGKKGQGKNREGPMQVTQERTDGALGGGVCDLKEGNPIVTLP